MALRVTTNIAAIDAERNLAGMQGKMQKSFAQLSSGHRITSAGDDPAGLAISENLKAQIRSTRQAHRNASDGVSMVQVAEGGLNTIGNMIIRLRELAMQAASDTVSHRDRGFINKEVQQLKDEIQRVANTTTWGKTKLLNGSTPNFDFQVGIFNNKFNDRISFKASKNVATLDALGLDGLDYTTKEGAQEALGELDHAQNNVSGMRANLGALQNRLQSTISNLGISEENLSAAKSRISDTDVAASTAALVKNKILMQAGIASLAQANQMNEVALNLIHG